MTKISTSTVEQATSEEVCDSRLDACEASATLGGTIGDCAGDVA